MLTEAECEALWDATLAYAAERGADARMCVVWARQVTRWFAPHRCAAVVANYVREQARRHAGRAMRVMCAGCGASGCAACGGEGYVAEAGR